MLSMKYVYKASSTKPSVEGTQLILDFSLMIDRSSNVRGEMNNVKEDGFPSFKVTLLRRRCYKNGDLKDLSRFGGRQLLC